VYNSSKKKFRSLRSQIVCSRTFQLVPLPLFGFIILTACSKFGQLILRKITDVIF